MPDSLLWHRWTSHGRAPNRFGSCVNCWQTCIFCLCCFYGLLASSTQTQTRQCEARCVTNQMTQIYLKEILKSVFSPLFHSNPGIKVNVKKGTAPARRQQCSCVCACVVVNVSITRLCVHVNLCLSLASCVICLTLKHARAHTHTHVQCPGLASPKASPVKAF